MLKSLSQSPIHDAGANPPPTRKVTDADGLVRTEKLPPMPSRKYVKASGSVVRIALTNAAALRNTNNSYGHRAHAKAIRNGMVPYGDCPARTLVGLPQNMRDETPCAPGSYGEHRACIHVERIIALRTEAHAKAEAASYERNKSQQQRHLELLERREERAVARELEDGSEE